MGTGPTDGELLPGRQCGPGHCECVIVGGGATLDRQRIVPRGERC